MFNLFFISEGLTLVLIIDSSEDSGIARNLGIRIKIHEADEIAFPQDDGFIFEAGYMFTVSISSVSRIRLVSSRHDQIWSYIINMYFRRCDNRFLADDAPTAVHNEVENIHFR